MIESVTFYKNLKNNMVIAHGGFGKPPSNTGIEMSSSQLRKHSSRETNMTVKAKLLKLLGAQVKSHRRANCEVVIGFTSEKWHKN